MDGHTRSHKNGSVIIRAIRRIVKSFVRRPLFRIDNSNTVRRRSAGKVDSASSARLFSSIFHETYTDLKHGFHCRMTQFFFFCQIEKFDDRNTSTSFGVIFIRTQITRGGHNLKTAITDRPLLRNMLGELNTLAVRRLGRSDFPIAGPRSARRRAFDYSIRRSARVTNPDAGRIVVCLRDYFSTRSRFAESCLFTNGRFIFSDLARRRRAKRTFNSSLIIHRK